MLRTLSSVIGMHSLKTFCLQGMHEDSVHYTLSNFTHVS